MSAPSFSVSASQPLARRVAGLQGRLLHITARNRSILLGSVHQNSAFDLSVLGPAAAEEGLRRLLRGSASMPIVPDRATDDESTERRRHIARLARSLHHQREETGLRTGNVGFPFLVGALDDDTWVRGPLVLIPVRLWRKEDGRDRGWHVALRDGTRPTANRALLAAVSKVRGVHLDDAFVEELDALLDDHGQKPVAEWDLEVLLNDLQDLLASHGVAAPVTGTEILPIPSLTKVDRETRKHEALHMQTHVVLGDFPQTNEPIHADYAGLAEAAADGDRDVSLLGRLLDVDEGVAPLPEAPDVPAIDDVPDAELGTVLHSNGAQDEILLHARHAPCTVVRGPPGTGKSQVITNLVSDALRHGEKVLVVCQKRAALDVVHERLEQTGLGGLALLVHDAQADRKDAFERLRHIIDDRPAPTAEGLEDLCQQIDGLVDALDRLAAFSQQEYRGLTFHEVYSEADPGYRPVLREPVLREATWTDVQGAVTAIGTLGPDLLRYRLEHAWRRRRDLGHGTPLRKVAVLERTQRLIDVLERPYYVDDAPELARLEEAFGTWNASKDRWWRIFSPTFLEARKEVLSFLASQGAALEDAPQWSSRVRQGRRVLEALDTLDPVITEAMRRRITDTPPEKAREAALAWHEGAADWDTLVQVDRDMAALATPVRRLVRLAMSRFGGHDDPAQPLVQEVLHDWIDDIEESQPELRGDPFREYQQKRRRLADLIEQRRDLMAQSVQVAHLAMARTPVLPAGEHHPNRKAETDWHQARALLERKRKIPTLRQLMRDRHQHVWARAARCWLMSPEAVSAVHPLEPGLFDLVVFDEASQLAVERALPAIYRAKRIVVAGDEQQLPPFDLFTGQPGQDDEELETESLLRLAQAAFGSRMLEWHYRSEHQELVEFSNQAYYDGGLKVVPSPAVDARPIRYHNAGGRFIDRRNGIEAERVVDVVADLLAKPERPSIGIVTFNKAQRDLIEERLEARADEDPAFGAAWKHSIHDAPERRPFVKNIENVQGDERDIIIFSTTYGPDAEGRLQTRFGIFNQRGGEHRLNVAITRARKQVHVVTSIDPDALDVASSTHAGPKHLKAYLQYARAVDAGDHLAASRVLASVASGQAATTATGRATRLHHAIMERLAEHGLQGTPLVGYSGYRIDIAVADPADPSRHLLAVELDGPRFCDARGARERDVARPRFLEARGWHVERVWSRNWFRDPRKQTLRLVGAVQDSPRPPR